MDVIQRYDEEFFNCYMGHVLSYLKQREVPVELAFYNCFESSQRMYQCFIVHRRDRWHFPTPYIELQLLGARPVTRYFTSFEEAKPCMLDIIHAGKAAFISGDGYYIPHRLDTYQRSFEPHNFIVTRYREGDEGPQWFVEDHNRHPDFFDYYNESIIRDFYDLADYPFGKYVTCFDIEQQTAQKPDKKQLYQKFVDYFDMYVDDFSTYDRILSNLRACEHDMQQLPGGLECYERMFFYLASSRELFRRFAEALPLEERLQELVKESISAAFAVRGQLLRANITKKLNYAKLEEAIERLKEAEPAILELIQKEHVKVPV